MHDPYKLTYDRTDRELEEFLVFCMAAAATNAIAATRAVTKLQEAYGPGSPLEIIRKLKEKLPEALRACGFRFPESRARNYYAVAVSGINLRTCTVQELEELPGIGPKTSRFFVMHSRPGEAHAVLDVHVMTYLRESGYPAPKRPTAANYLKWQKIFLEHAKSLGITDIASLDLELWSRYRQRPKLT